MAESLIAIVFLWLVLGACVEVARLFHAKAALNHATLQAARGGMVANAQPQALINGLARGLLPLFGPQPGLADAGRVLAEVALPEVVAFSRVRILNPTRRAFDDFAEDVDGRREIPNEELHRRPTAVGASSGVNIQDANLLKIEVVYGFPLRVPLIDEAITQGILAFGPTPDAFRRALLEANRIPILASATVRMQSPARPSRLVVN